MADPTVLKPRFYEFFAGAGLANLGLGDAWECIWANDICPRKSAVYRRNFGGDHLVERDLNKITPAELPVPADLAWASFPCQDLSLAGWGRGLHGERSGVFWAFWRIVRDLHPRPPVIAIENVAGLLYGDNFTGVCEAMAALNMQFGALVIDARLFVPQSRPRVFLVALDARFDCARLTRETPQPEWTPRALRNAHNLLPTHLLDKWRWWHVPVPTHSTRPAATIIEEERTWHTSEQTAALLALMSEANREKVARVLQAGNRQAGFLYKRIRDGVQRAEVRFDGVAGCLRTPGGGSSRQTVLVVDGGHVRSRLLSPREAARLMGVPDTFQLPERYADAYKAMGDGVAVPVVSWLAKHLLKPAVELSRYNRGG